MAASLTLTENGLAVEVNDVRFDYSEWSATRTLRTKNAGTRDGEYKLDRGQRSRLALPSPSRLRS